MRTRIQRWGNSLAVRIPRTHALELSLREDSAVDLVIEEGELVLRPVRPETVSLDGLLSSVTPENLHGETDFGGPEGNEAW